MYLIYYMLYRLVYDSKNRINFDFTFQWPTILYIIKNEGMKTSYVTISTYLNLMGPKNNWKHSIGQIGTNDQLKTKHTVYIY